MNWILPGLDYLNKRTQQQKEEDKEARRAAMGGAGRFYEDCLELEITAYYLRRTKGYNNSFESLRYRDLCLFDRDLALELCKKANADLDATGESLKFGTYGSYWSVCNQQIYKLKTKEEEDDK